MRPTPAGAQGWFAMTVSAEHLANRYEDASLPAVLATPVMIMAMENAALEALKPYFETGESAVGTRVDVSHLAATPAGRRIVASAEVTASHGRHIEFRVNAMDGSEEIGRGNRRAFIVVVGANVLAAVAMPTAGQRSPAFRVAWVSPDRAGSPSPNPNAFRAAMEDLGYVEGKNVVIDTWWGEGSAERLEQMAGDILRSRPDVIVTGSGLAVEPLMRAGVKIPIVFVISADPVAAKIVESFSHPGGNLTGISLLSLDLMPKRIEFLK